MKKYIFILAALLLSSQAFSAQEIPEVDIDDTILSLESSITEYQYASELDYQNYSNDRYNHKQAKKRSPFSQLGTPENNIHAAADAVFADIESYYPSVFPRTSPAAEEFVLSDGSVAYMKIYDTGAALAEYQGYLFYLIPGYEFEVWGLISDW